VPSAALVSRARAWGEHDRVVVDVDDARLRRGLLRHLVRVVRGGQAGPDIEELPDTHRGGEMVHGRGQERPPRAGDRSHGRHDLQDLFRDGAVGGEIVLAAQPVIPDPGRVRHRGVKVAP
jgi:hypothetical protein